MKLANLKKYIFGNIISIFGYVALAFYIYYFFLVRSKELALEAEIIAEHGEAFLTGLYETAFFIFYFFILFFILVLLSIEFLIRKKIKIIFLNNTSMPTYLLKLHNILFWIGIFFASLPLLYIIWILIDIFLVYSILDVFN